MSGQKAIALILGILLVLIGIAGFIKNPLIGEQAFIKTTSLHNILYLIVGAFGIYTGIKGKGKKYNFIIGWIALIIGIIGFIPYIKDRLAAIAQSGATTGLHLAIGIIALLTYYTSSNNS